MISWPSGRTTRALTAVLGIAMSLGACGPGTPSRIEILSGNGQSAESGTHLANPIRLRAVDDGGKGVANVFLRYIVSGDNGGVSTTMGGPEVGLATDTTDALGEAEFYWKLGPPLGEQTMGVSVVDDLGLPILGIPGIQLKATAVVGPPDKFTADNGNGGSAEVGTAADPLVVLVLDRSSNPVPGVDVTWGIVSGGGSLTATTSTTDNTGRASTVLTVGGGVGDNVVTASLPGLSDVQFSVIGLNVIADAANDAVPGTAGQVAPELISYGAVVLGGTAIFHFRFASTAASSAAGGPNQVVGFLEMDLDQNPATGGVPISDDRPGNTTTGMGIEARIPLQLSGASHQVFRLPSGATAGTIPAAFTGRVITLRVPLSLLPDDGNLNYVILVGTPRSGLGILDQTQPTDWAPDNGSATLTSPAPLLRNR